jgi:hypothetical protein
MATRLRYLHASGELDVLVEGQWYSAEGSFVESVEYRVVETDGSSTTTVDEPGTWQGRINLPSNAAREVSVGMEIYIRDSERAGTAVLIAEPSNGTVELRGSGPLVRRAPS